MPDTCGSNLCDTEFDSFADEYIAMHGENTKLTGEDPEYFARQKIEIISSRWFAEHRKGPARILDFGTGIGNSLPHLRRAFPEAALTGLDVSTKSLAVAERRFPGIAKLVSYDGEVIPLPSRSFDLIFSACVFHHIDADAHVPLLSQLRGLLGRGGWLTVFEHNPYNPVTRHIVNTCAFDENAVLIRAPEFRRRQQAAGLRKVEIAYTSFFPRALARLRPLERRLTRVPLGAQYYTLSRE